MYIAFLRFIVRIVPTKTIFVNNEKIDSAYVIQPIYVMDFYGKKAANDN
jgi:hypothetical protein